MTKINWIQHNEPNSSQNNPRGLPDVTNRPLRELMQLSGYDPDADFTGFSGIQVVANQAELDALPTSNNKLVQQKDIGYFKRYDSARGKWLPNGLTRDAGPVVSAQSQGLVGDGVANDAPYILAADVLAGAKGRMEIDPVTSKVSIQDNLQINSHFRPWKGASIYVAAGKTLTINAEFDPGFWQVFDPTSPGNIVFTKVRKFYPEWFGVKGDKIVDDTPALKFMSRIVPDYAVCQFENAMNLRITSEWLTMARRGVRYYSVIHPFPDGQASNLYWDGPAPQLGRGVNAATFVNGSQIVNFAQPLSRIPQAGERLVVRFSGPGVMKLNALVVDDGLNTTTRVKIDTPATQSVALTKWTLGGVMVAMISSDHCELTGFTFFFDGDPTTNQVGQGFAGWINAGTNTLHNASGDPAANLNKVGHMIRVLGVGPGGTDLVTTIDAAAGDGTSATLHDNATLGIAADTLAQYMIGVNDHSMAAVVGVMLDLTNRGATGTNCYVTKCLFNGATNDGFMGVSISAAEDSNQELHEIRWNTFHMGDFGGLQHDFSGHCTTVAGNNQIATDQANLIKSTFQGYRVRVPGVGRFTFTVADAYLSGNHLTFTEAASVMLPTMVGDPNQVVRITGAGPAGADLVTYVEAFKGPGDVTLHDSSSIGAGNVAGYVTGVMLDTKVITYVDNQHFTALEAPSVSAAGKTPSLGNCTTVGIDIGDSFNAKRIVIENNIFAELYAGVWLHNGSFMSRGNQAEVVEYFFIMDGGSTPCVSDHDDHEAALRMLGTSTPRSGGCPYSMAFKGSRLGTLNMVCQGGHFQSGPTSGPISITDVGFDTAPNSVESTFFEHHGGSWYVDNATFPTDQPSGPGLTTMSQIIDKTYLLSIGGRFFGRNFKNVSDVPGHEFFWGRNVSPAMRSVFMQEESGESHVLDLTLVNIDDSTLPLSTARFRFESGGGGPSQEVGAIDAGIGQTADSANNGYDPIDSAAIIVRLPTAANWKNTYGGHAVRGLHVKSPGPANNVTNPVVGVQIEAMANTGITTPRGLWQEGASDKNLLAGRTVQSMPSTAPADADINPGQASFYLDEVGNTRKTRVRYSGGTYKTETSSALV